MEVVPDPQPGDLEKHILRMKLKTTRFDNAIFFGLDAAKLRELGCTNIPENIPDCAKFGPGGFEWVEVDFTVEPKR